MVATFTEDAGHWSRLAASVALPHRMLVGGEDVDGAGTLPIVSPRDGRTLVEDKGEQADEHDAPHQLAKPAVE